MESGHVYAYQTNYSGFLQLKAQREEMARAQRAQAGWRICAKKPVDSARGDGPLDKSRERIERFEKLSAIERIQGS